MTLFTVRRVIINNPATVKRVNVVTLTVE